MIAVAIVLGVLLLLAVLAAVITYRITFHAKKKTVYGPEDRPLPTAPKYAKYLPQLRRWMDEAAALPYREARITSFDGLGLYGRFYELAPDAPVEIMFHGYRSAPQRDFCNGVQRGFALGRSVLLVDQRACGRSEGNAVTFGILEHRDCLGWIDWVAAEFGPERPVYLTGISMGATTVLLAAGTQLPPSVKGVLADCGFSSAREIIKKVARDRHFPATLLYPLTRLSARLWAGFDPDSDTALAAVQRATVPIAFIHGEADDFVPCHMSVRMYEACAAPKALLTVPDAVHAVSFPEAPDAYMAFLKDFFSPSTHKEMIEC